VGKWADEKLKEILGGFKYIFAGGELKVTSVYQFKGESSINIRKGKKIVSYDYSFDLTWACILRDGEGKEIGKISGSYNLPEVSNDIDDDGEEWEIKNEYVEDRGNIRSRVENIVKKDAPNALRKDIKAKFVSELKLK
jgi:activator of HSP90 ATPase